MKPRDAPTLINVLRDHSERWGERPAYTFLDHGEREASSLSYGELDLRARAIAAALQEAGLGGERALLLYGAGLDFVTAFWGCLYAGVVAVPSYPPKLRDRSGRLEALAADCRPRAVLTSATLGEGSRPGVERLLAAVGEHTWVYTDEVTDGKAAAWGPARLDAGDVAFIQYTSGSTSEPKGVLVSHGNLMHNEEMIRRAFRQSEDSVVVSWLPLYHDMGLIGGVLQPVYCGGRCILMSPLSFLQKPVRWLAAMSRYRGTTSGGPDFAYDLCARKVSAEQAAGLDLGSWRTAFNGSEPVRSGTLERFAAAFGSHGFRREAFYPCYGLAEATLFVAGGKAGEPLRLRSAEAAGEENVGSPPLVGCGRSWLEQRLVIADPESGLARPEGEVGEIWVAGPSVALGYWRRPEETAACFGATLATGEGPYLRTGDLGFLRDGELFITGRLKDLIILRGRNVYPQDLEHSAGRSHPALRRGCGAAFTVPGEPEELLVVVQEIEPRHENAGEAAAEAARRAVAEEHEAQAHEILIVAAGAVPRTSSGKVRRRACRALYIAGELPVVARNAVAEELDNRAPVSPGPSFLPELERLLGRDLSAVPRDERLTRLGLDSLAAVTLAHRLEALGASVTPEKLLDGLTFGELLDRLEEVRSLPRQIATAEDACTAGSPLLSYGERALWLLDRLGGWEEGAYNVGGAMRVHGPFDRSVLQRGFQVLIDRHPALRTTFVAVGGEPQRRVCEDLKVAVDEEDASTLDDRALAGRLLTELERPFDLAAGPLLRLRLYANAPEGHVLLFVAHHICCDFWSLAVMARELAEFCSPGMMTAAPPASAGEDGGAYAERQRRWLASPEGEAQWSYWRDHLAGDLPNLELPVDRPRPPLQTFRGGSWSDRVDAATSEAARALGRTAGVTLSTVLIAAFVSVLSRVTGQQDVVVGTPTAGRRSAGAADAVGYRVNPVVLRADLAGDPTFADLLDRLRHTVLAAYAHQEYPFPLLAERLRPARDAGRPPLFQALCVLHQDLPAGPAGLAALAAGVDGAAVELGALTCELLSVRARGAQLDLTLAGAGLAAGLALSLGYNRELFDAATIRRFAGSLGRLLSDAVEHPQTRVSELALLTASERRQLLEWGGARGAGQEPAAGDTLVALFEAQVRRAPGARAVTCQGNELTYGELNAQANRLAHLLRRLGVGPEARVGLCVERSAELVVGMLGIVKAGGAYLPLDPSYPRERLAFLIEDAGARVLVGSERALTSLPAPAGVLAVRLDGPAAEELELCPQTDPPAVVEVDHLAYVIYTSGSTGQPKGVLVTHANVVRLLRATAPWFLFGPDDVWTLFHSYAFDFSVWEIWGALLQGGRLVVVPWEVSRTPASFHDLLANERVTILNQTPTAFAELSRAGEGPSRPRPLADLRLVIFGGEALSPDRLAGWLARYGDVRPRLVNMYGITETTVHVTYRPLSAEDARPGKGSIIGLPIPDLAVYVLDPAGRLAPIGVPGELAVGGAGLARGYSGRPDLTAVRFVPDPFSRPGARLYRSGDLGRFVASGELEYLGRIDQQVKIRGFRIEPGEIEAALCSHPAVRGSAVALHRTADGDRRLVAYVVPARAEEDLDFAALRGHLASRLPDPMMPALFVRLPDLPLTPSGKLDRRALPAPVWNAGRSAGQAAAYRTPLEEIVAGILAQALGFERIDADEDFFALGGHSLLAVRAMAAIGDAVGRDLPATALFSHSTAARLASWIEAPADGGPGSTGRAAPPIRRRADALAPPLSFAQRRLWLLHHLDSGGSLYNCPLAVRLLGDLQPVVFSLALAEVMRRHEALRTVFPERLGEPVQRILPPKEGVHPWLPIVDLSALPDAVRGARELELRCAEACRPFDLSRGPLLRAVLVKLGEREHVALMTMHHIVSDDWSLSVLARELSALYAAFREGRPSPLPELPAQYSDFAAWQREWLAGEALEGPLRYWRGELAGAPAGLALPTDREPESAGARGAFHGFEVPAPTCDQLDRLSRRAGTSLFMTLLAAFQTLLYRWCGQDDLVVGVDIANRTRPETEPLIGFFVNLLPLRADLRDNPTFEELLKRVRRATLGAFAHQDLPFERIVEELRPERVPGQTPLARVVFSFRPAPREPLRLPGVAAEPLPWEGFAKRDLTLFMERRETGLGGAWSYRTDLFEPATIARLAGRFETLLTSIAERPAERLDALEIEPLDVRARGRQERSERKEARLSRLLKLQAVSAPVPGELTGARRQE